MAEIEKPDGGVPDQEAHISGSEKEGATLSELVELAETVQAVPETPEVIMEEKTEALKAEEGRERAEREHEEKVQEFAFQSGAAHYLEFTNPTLYEQKAREDLEERARKNGWAHPGAGVYGTDNRISKKGLRDGNFSESGSEVGYANSRRAVSKEDYLPAIKDSYSSVLNRPFKSDEERKRNQDLYLPRLQKHAEGFGRAALEAGDLAVSVDNLNEAGVLENPEVLTAIKGRMEELKKSGKVEDAVKLRQVSERLLAIQAKKKSEGGER